MNDPSHAAQDEHIDGFEIIEASGGLIIRFDDDRYSAGERAEIAAAASAAALAKLDEIMRRNPTPAQVLMGVAVTGARDLLAADPAAPIDSVACRLMPDLKTLKTQALAGDMDQGKRDAYLSSFFTRTPVPAAIGLISEATILSVDGLQDCLAVTTADAKSIRTVILSIDRQDGSLTGIPGVAGAPAFDGDIPRLMDECGLRLWGAYAQSMTLTSPSQADA